MIFDKLTFASPKEEADFQKYKKLKGIYLHKQVYDILLEANGGEEVTYYELSSIIRYDKNLRDTLYIYLATVEEQLRVLLSELYFKLQTDFKVLMETCVEKNIVSISDEAMSLVKLLRNDVMHHHLLIFGGARNLKEAKDNFAAFERKIDALITLLPTEYVIGFRGDITKLNGASHEKHLTKFYLEENNGKLRICI